MQNATPPRLRATRSCCRPCRGAGSRHRGQSFRPPASAAPCAPRSKLQGRSPLLPRCSLATPSRRPSSSSACVQRTTRTRSSRLLRPRCSLRAACPTLQTTRARASSSTARARSGSTRCAGGHPWSAAASPPSSQRGSPVGAAASTPEVRVRMAGSLAARCRNQRRLAAVLLVTRDCVSRVRSLAAPLSSDATAAACGRLRAPQPLLRQPLPAALGACGVRGGCGLARRVPRDAAGSHGGLARGRPPPLRHRTRHAAVRE